MQTCPYCGSEFEPKHRVGRPRIYCRPTCRANAGRARREARQAREIAEAAALLKAFAARDSLTPDD